MKMALWSCLSRFPNGVFRVPAQARLAALPSAAQNSMRVLTPNVRGRFVR